MDAGRALGRSPVSRSTYWAMAGAAGMATGVLAFYPFAWHAGSFPIPPWTWPLLALVQASALAWWTRLRRPGPVAVGLLSALGGFVAGWVVASWLYFAVSTTPEV